MSDKDKKKKVPEQPPIRPLDEPIPSEPPVPGQTPGPPVDPPPDDDDGSN